MTQSPYSSAIRGQTVGQPPPASSDFGATTVSGSGLGQRRDPAAPMAAPTTAVPSVDSPSRPTPGAAPIPGPLPGQGPAHGAKPVGEPKTGPRGAASGAAGRARGPRRARLQLRHIDPWTVLKFSCVLSIALFFVWLIVVGVLYGVLDAAGAIGKVNDTVTTINGSGSKAPITAGVVFGGAAIIGVVNIMLFIALSTIGAVVYNLCADLVGGIELTLSER